MSTLNATTVNATTVSADTLKNVAGVEVYTCRAWVNFNGTGTVAIRASGNVSSITDNGTGDYTVNFTNAMPDANYSVTGISGQENTTPNSNEAFLRMMTRATNNCRVSPADNVNNAVDAAGVCVSIFR